MQEWWTWLALAVARLAGAPGDDVWLERLMALDAVRAEAVAVGDASVLSAVYPRGSTMLRDDTRLIAEYRAREAVVDGSGLVVWWFRVRTVSATRAEVEVVDQLGPTRVTWADGTVRRLPQDRPTRRVVTLVMTPDGWRIGGASAA